MSDMKLTHRQLVDAAIELNKFGAEIKNPRFIKSQELEKKLLLFIPDDWKGISDQTVQVLLALGVKVPVSQKEDSVVFGDKSVLPDNLKSREALEIAARDMNEVMGLNPGIDLSLDNISFMRAFVKAAGMADVSDPFSDYTWDVLAAHGLGPKYISVISEKNEKLHKTVANEAMKSGVAASEKPKKLSQKIERSGQTIVSIIRAFLDARYAEGGDKQFLKDEVIERLKTVFPDRPEKALRKTLQNQLTFGPYLPAKGYKFERIDANTMRIVSIPA